EVACWFSCDRPDLTSHPCCRMRSDVSDALRHFYNFRVARDPGRIVKATGRTTDLFCRLCREVAAKSTNTHLFARVALIRREIHRLCRGGSKRLTNPGVRFTRSQILMQPVAHEVLLLTLTGCDQAPLRGQHP